MKLGLVAAAGAALFTANTANAITYVGSLTTTEFYDSGSGTLSAIYTIDTDGTLGVLGPANFAGFTLSIDYNGDTVTDSGMGVFSGFGYGATATPTSLSFDFASANMLIFYGINDNALCFSGVDSISCNLEPVPSISINSFPFNAFGYVFVDNPGVEVIATATTVPEPASWALMIAGFGLTGAAMRRAAAGVNYTAGGSSRRG